MMLDGSTNHEQCRPYAYNSYSLQSRFSLDSRFSAPRSRANGEEYLRLVPKARFAPAAAVNLPRRRCKRSVALATAVVLAQGVAARHRLSSSAAVGGEGSRRRCSLRLSQLHWRGVAHLDAKPDSLLANSCGGRPEDLQ
jgi:hypothetical protein